MTDKPFTKRDENDHVSMNPTRLVESVIIAGLTSVLSIASAYFVTIPTLQVELTTVKDQVRTLVGDQRHANASAVADRADIIRLQSQMANTQQKLSETQAQITDVARSSTERLTIIERQVLRSFERNPFERNPR